LEFVVVVVVMGCELQCGSEKTRDGWGSENSKTLLAAAYFIYLFW
jgi:hypothetical protein